MIIPVLVETLHERSIGSLSTPGPLAPVAFTLLALTWIALGFRIWTRCWVSKLPGWDDWTMCLTQVCFTVMIIAACIDARLSLTAAANPGKPDLVFLVIDWLLVAYCTYIFTMSLFKISMGLFFLRIATAPIHRRMIYCTTTLSSACGIAYFIYIIMGCGGPAKRREHRKKTGADHCYNDTVALAVGYSYAAVVAITDIFFVILPALLLRKSPMRKGLKITAIVILVLANFGCVASLVRMKYLRNITLPQLNFTMLIVWSAIEPGVCIIASCLATLRPLARRFAGSTEKDDQSEEKSQALNGQRHQNSPNSEESFPDSLPHDLIKEKAMGSISSSRGNSLAGSSERPHLSYDPVYLLRR